MNYSFYTIDFRHFGPPALYATVTKADGFNYFQDAFLVLPATITESARVFHRLWEKEGVSTDLTPTLDRVGEMWALQTLGDILTGLNLAPTFKLERRPLGHEDLKILRSTGYFPDLAQAHMWRDGNPILTDVLRSLKGVNF